MIKISDALRGRDNSFDIIRFLAAFSVIYSHSFDVTGTAEPLDLFSNGKFNIGHLAVAIFFIISGFVISFTLSPKITVI